jgi:hypothetical protein
LPAAFPDEGDISLGPLPGWAGIPAGSYAAFFNGIGVWHSLGVKFVNSMSLLQASIKWIWHNHRANFFTITAGDTFFRIDIPGTVP